MSKVFTSKTAADAADTLNDRKYTKLANTTLEVFPELLWTWDREEIAELVDCFDDLVSSNLSNLSKSSRESYDRAKELGDRFTKWDQLPTAQGTALGRFYLFFKIELEIRDRARDAKKFINNHPKEVVEAFLKCKGDKETFSVANPLLDPPIYRETHLRLNRIRTCLKRNAKVPKEYQPLEKEIFECQETMTIQ